MCSGKTGYPGRTNVTYTRFTKNGKNVGAHELGIANIVVSISILLLP